MTAGIQRGALFVLLFISACRPASGAGDLDASGDEALRVTTALESRLEGVVDDVALLKSERTMVEDEIERLARRLEGVQDELRAGVRDLRATLDESEASAAEALARVDSVSGSLEELRREIAVLTERYDFHLKRYHAGDI